MSRALTLAARIDSILAGSGRPVTPVIVRGNGLEGLQELRLSDPVIPAPTGYGTDLGGLLADVAANIVGRPVRAVVLLSDGQETSQQAVTTSERGRRQVAGSHGGTPQVFAADGTASVALAVVGLGDPTGPADRILKDLRYPDTAFAGDEVVVELAVTHRFATEQDLTPVTARLFDADGRLVREATTEVTAPVTRMELAFIPQGEGLQVYRLELSDLDNERFHQNNEASLAINVAKERSRLLLLAARPGWDVRFLAQSAQQEQRLALSIVYRGADGLVLADSTGRAVAWQPPATAAQWLAYDGVILTDWSDQGAEPDWTTLSEAVDQGLGLLVLPGVAVSGESGRAVPPPGPLAELLPVTSTTWRWSDEAYAVVPPAETAGHPLRSGADGRGDLGPGLALLPPLRAVVPTEVRTEALTLLAARRQHGDAESTRYPLLVAGKRQQGRIVFFAGRRLWELAFWDPAPWSSEAGRNEQPARRLMRNLLVWTASGEQEAGLALVGRRAFFQEGERIRLAARWRDIRGGAVTDRGLTLALWPTAAAGDSTRVRTFG